MIGVKLTSRLPQLRAELMRKVEKAMNDAADDIAIEARRRVPVDTGALKDSIAVESYRGARSGSAKRVVAGEDYAVYVEYGTRFQAGQPFLTPAFDAVRPKLLRKLSRLEGK